MNSSGYLWLLGSSRSGHNFVGNSVRSWFKENHREYVNYENVSPKKFIEINSNIPKHIEDISLKVICLRDLLNWLSSSYNFLRRGWRFKLNTPVAPLFKNIYHKSEITPALEKRTDLFIIPDSISKEDFFEILKGRDPMEFSERFKLNLDVWYELAQEFKGDTNYLGNTAKIYYDDFFASRSYRQKICKEVGGKYSEEVLNTVTAAGRYSTFDGDEFQGRAQEMKVLERYKLWNLGEEKDVVVEHLVNSPILEYYLNNFEVNDDKKKFIEKWILD